MDQTPYVRVFRRVKKLVSEPHFDKRTDAQLLDAFATDHDEAVFTELVARHGAMVLRVCRRTLHHEQDAEDAFQATFLALAQHAGTIRKRDCLPEWLHGVAYRLAVNAKRSAGRRRNHETRKHAQTPLATPEPTWSDVQSILDDEIDRLPTPFRKVFVLCVLEGKSGSEAANILGLKEGTVSSRLTRARQRLQQRLTRRGIKLGTLLAALSIAEQTGSAALPEALSQATVRLGLSAMSKPIAGSIPQQVATLAAGVSQAMFLHKAKIAAALVVLIGLVVAGVSALTREVVAAGEQAPETPKSKPLETPPPLPKTTTAKAKPEITDETETITYSGRVIGPDGTPVGGANLFLSPAMGYLKEPYSSPECAKTLADGRFKFSASKSKFQGYTVVAASAATFGVGWLEIPDGRKKDGLTIRLVKDAGPLNGQIVDLEGKPIAHATLRVKQIHAASNEDLGPFIEAANGKKGSTFEIERQYLKNYTIAFAPTFTADAQGRFRITGIGPNRVVRAQIEGPTIATQHVAFLTRDGKNIEVINNRNAPREGERLELTTYYADGFKVIAAPTKPIVGIVRDKDTKKPIPGVTIRSYSRSTGPSSSRILNEISRTTTDATGRFRLTGLPKGDGYRIMAIPNGDVPYVCIHKDVPKSVGLEPVAVDIDLKRGIWIEGKITNKVSGELVKGHAEYYSMYDNPNLTDYPGYDGTILMDEKSSSKVKEDGCYRVVGLPGPGVVGVYYQRDFSLRANERDDAFGTKEESLTTAPYHISFTSNFNALAPVDPPKDAATFKQDITIDPGASFTVNVVGPDGKPLRGVRGHDLATFGWWFDENKPAQSELSVRGFNTKRPRDIVLQHVEKGLVGVVKAPLKMNTAVTVQLMPGVVAVGRLLDAKGKLRPNAALEVAFHPKNWGHFCEYLPDRIKTDADGRFRIEGLLSGYKFQLSDGSDAQFDFDTADVRLGQTKDLGDVRLKAATK